MSNFSTSRALGMMRKTAPFIVFRAVVYFAIAVAYVVVTGTGAGFGWIIGAFGDADFQASATFWGGGIGFAATAGVLYFLREYTLYIVKAGHIAVMVELLEGRELPSGRAQIEHAQKIVKARFKEASVLFAIDQLVKGVIRVVTGLLQGLMGLLPIPGLDRVMSLVRAYLRVAVGLIDEVILAHAIRTKAENPWTSAQEALVLYAQNAKPMLISAIWLTAITYGLSFIVFLFMLAPAAAVVYIIPGAWSAGGFVFAVLFAWAVKVALIEPFAIACLLMVFFRETEGQKPDPEWMEKLDGASSRFGELAARAKTWTGLGPDGTGKAGAKGAGL